MGFWKTFKQAAGITAGLYVGWEFIGKGIGALFEATTNTIAALCEGGFRGICEKFEKDVDDFYGEDESSTEEEES